MLIEGFAPREGPPAGPDQPASNLAGAAPQVLAGIQQPGTSIAIWARRLPGNLIRDLAGLAACAPFAVTVEDAPDEAVGRMAEGLPQPAPIDLLLDVLHLARIFTHVTRADRLRLRLEALDGPGCHRWHADAIGLRLLCTYRGPGTEWLALPGGARAARMLQDGPPPPANRLNTGEVALLKGEGFPGHAGQGCIHRSPPRAPGAPPRLLLCLDEAGRIPLE
ncbi:DUF1826 domain-containing protein [Falsiroseomonas sp.]|uniref:DUF1826 domain-containing protein n=1 Tax=Falsiroseomonas sp. TaxID=2870721 RepID=UPI00273765DF|nr:DUF1826 domain-containing protein [Falsiroseomonas sp.]MDP3417802.1 DUF1826 domain-containing protein [Falsiroseomonas sp.]